MYLEHYVFVNLVRFGCFLMILIDTEDFLWWPVNALKNTILLHYLRTKSVACILIQLILISSSSIWRTDEKLHVLDIIFLVLCDVFCESLIRICHKSLHYFHFLMFGASKINTIISYYLIFVSVYVVDTGNLFLSATVSTISCFSLDKA